MQTAADVQQPWCMMKKMSVAVVLFFIPLLYVSLLHATPSQLVKDSAFWFVMSNSIILILAAESGTLSSSSSSSSSGCAAGNGATSALADVAAPRYTQPAGPPAIQEVPDTSAAESATTSELPPTALSRKRKVRRSKSSVTKPPGSEGASKVIRRSATAMEMAVMGATAEEEAELGNKYAELSLEELNRRVEEFIRGFNRKMMLEIENEGIITAGVITTNFMKE